MSYSFTVEWDSAGDGTFSTNITAYVMECKINRGRKTDLGKMPAGTAMLVLNNHDGRFSPDKADGPHFGNLQIYRRVRIKGTVVGASTYGMFYGFLLDWDNKPRITQQYVTWFLGDRFALWQYLSLNLPFIRKMDILPALHLAVNRAEGLNVISNPSLEQNADGWSVLGAASGARDDTMKGEGDWAYRVACPGSAGGEGARYTATADYDTLDWFAGGILAKCSEGTVSVRFRAIGAGGELAGFNYTLTTSWQYLPLYWGVTSRWAAGVKYFDLYTNQASEVIIWADALQGWEGIEAVYGMTRLFDSGTPEIELAASYRQPALEVLQAIAESEPRSFFFIDCENTSYLERLRFRDKDWRDTAPLQASFRDKSLATTNYVKDPSFEHTTLGDHWTFTGGIHARSNEQAEYGSYSLKGHGTGLAEGYCNVHQVIADRPAASQGEVWTASAYFYPTVKTNIDVFELCLCWFDSEDGYLGSDDSATIGIESGFTRYMVSGTAPANTAKVELSVRLHVQAGGGGAITYYMDGCQLEEKTAVTRYCDGDQPGCTWAGTAHESTSSRGAAIPYHDLIYGEHAIDRISEAEVTSQGDLEDENVSATIWELSPVPVIIPATETEVFHAFYPQPARDCSLSVNPEGTPTCYPIAASGDDGHIQRWEDGGHPPDANAAAYDDRNPVVGQAKSGTVYHAFRSYLRFDTSPIDDGATITAAKLRLRVESNHTDTDFTVQVRDCAWGPALAVGDWDGTGTIRGTYATSGLPPAGEWIEIDIAVAGIDKTGYTEFEIMSDNEGVAPTGHEHFYFTSYDKGNPPELTVTLQGSQPDSEVFENYGVGAKITIGAGADPALIEEMTIIGVPLRGSSEESRVVAASASPPAIERTLHHALPLQGTRTSSMETEATRLANRYDGRIRRCSLALRPKNDTILTQMLAREIGELIHIENINDAFSTHMDVNVWIEGIDHYFKKTPEFFETTFHLEEE